MAYKIKKQKYDKDLDQKVLGLRKLLTVKQIAKELDISEEKVRNILDFYKSLKPEFGGIR